MTQAYLKGSAGQKSMEEGRKSETGGAHGGPEDEGPCRYPARNAQPSTINCHKPFRLGEFMTSLRILFAPTDSEREQAAAKRKAEIRAKRVVQEAHFILGCINGLEQPGGYLSQAEFNIHVAAL